MLGARAAQKYYDVYVAERSPAAYEALTRIGALYAIEREIRGQPPAVRAAARRGNAAPLLAELRDWLRGECPTERQGAACRGDPVHARAMGGADALLRRRRPRDRQQRRRARDPRARARPSQLPLRRLGRGRRDGGAALQPDRHLPAERPRSASLPAPRARADRYASDQPRRGTAALARCRGTRPTTRAAA